MITSLPTTRFAGVFTAALIGFSQFSSAEEAKSLTSIYPADSWERIDQSVDKALVWLIEQQQPDGSFLGGHIRSQPAVTSLTVMAFLSRGHVPGSGPYGDALLRAIDYTLSCQQDAGYISAETFKTEGEERPKTAREQQMNVEGTTVTASYNHTISSLMLAEVFGMVGGERSYRIKNALDRGLTFSYRLQDRFKTPEKDRGGTRYIGGPHQGRDSDLSLTAWYLTLLRAAKNAGFDVPDERVELAVGYVRRTYSSRRGVFNYYIDREESRPAMMGAGALSLALAGEHDDKRLEVVAKTLPQINFPKLLATASTSKDFPMYASYYGSQAAAQIGGECWRKTYTAISNSLLRIQKPEGKWQNIYRARWVGDTYTTALGVLTLTTPYQLLPIYQR